MKAKLTIKDIVILTSMLIIIAVLQLIRAKNADNSLSTVSEISTYIIIALFMLYAARIELMHRVNPNMKKNNNKRQGTF